MGHNFASSKSVAICPLYTRIIVPTTLVYIQLLKSVLKNRNNLFKKNQLKTPKITYFQRQPAGQTISNNQ